MGQEKKGFMQRMIMGKERDDDYARSTLPTSRWSLFWDIFKGRLGKLCIINLLMVLFCLPLVAVFVFRYIGEMSLGASLPFMGNFGIGFPCSLDVQLQYILQKNSTNNFIIMPLLIPASLIAAVGISGGFYVMRNMVWTEGTFIANDFWRGIRLNIKHLLLTALLYSVIIYVSSLNFAMVEQLNYIGKGSVWLTISQVTTVIVLVLFTIMVMYMITLTVTYKLKFWQLIKNSFILTIGMLFQNIFFIVLGLAPLIVGLLLSLFMGMQMILTLLIMVYLLIGISVFVLAWTNFNQWVFDKFINDKVEGAVKNRGIYPKVKDGEEIERRKKAAVAKFQNPKKKRAVKPVTDEDVQLTNLEQGGFTRANIQKLTEEKEQLKKDADQYAEEAKLRAQRKEEEIEESGDEDDAEDDDSAYEGYEDAMLLEGYSGGDGEEVLNEDDRTDEDDPEKGE